MDEILVYEKFMEMGVSMKLEGKQLLDFVETKVTSIREREERKLERDEAEKTREIEEREKDRILQLELAKLKSESEEDVSFQPNGDYSGGRSFIKLAVYRDGDCVDAYLRNFEQVRDANQWSEKVAITALQNGFTGSRIMDLISTLPFDITYDEMKKVILKSYGLSVYDYRDKFINLSQKSENFRQFILRMSNYLTRWTESCEVEDFVALKELMIKDQILKSVQRNLSDYLKEKNIFNLDLDEIVDLADNFLSIHGTMKLGKVNTVDVNDSGVKNKPICFKCSQVGHIAKFCQSNTLYRSNHAAKSDGNLRTCFKCNKVGHIARFCRSDRSKFHKQTGNGTNYLTVDRENKDNHKFHDVTSVVKSGSLISNKLPVTFGKVNGKNVKVLRDTGCSTVIVNADLIDKSELTSNFMELRFANNETSKVPVATVKLECPFYTGTIDVACANDISFDVLLGNIPGALCPCKLQTCEEMCQCLNCLDGRAEKYVCAVQTRSKSKTENVPETALQSNMSELNLDAISSKNLVEFQKVDPSLSFAFDKVQISQPSYPKFLIINDVLVRQNLKRKDCKDVVTQIMLPTCLRNKVMTIAHDSVWAGHLGINKTQARVLNHFYWPGIYGDIRRFCRSCEVCQKVCSTKPSKNSLISMPVISTPFSRVAIDIVGPLVKSKRNNRFILVAIDMATRYPDAIPLRTIDADRVAEALIEIFSRTGLPSELLHDQGTNFMSKVMARFNDLMHIKRVNTTPYHPQTNGLCENFNRTLVSMIKRLANDDPENWDRFIPALLFAYREIPQKSTGFSPFELLFSYDVRGPLFLIKEKFLNLDLNAEQLPVTEFVLKIRDKLRDLIKLANDNDKLAKDRQKVYYDRSSRNRKFKVGDKVLLLLPTSANKLLAEWKGPYEIVRKLNKVDYIVRMGDTEKSFHVNMLKIFNERPELVNFVTVSPNVEDLTELDLMDKSEICTENVSVEFNVSENLTIEERAQLENLLENQSSVFKDIPGLTDLFEYEIKVDANVKPVRLSPYKVPFNLRAQVNKEILKWLELGIIRPSRSEWSFPIVIVTAPGKDLRICVDYRKLNPLLLMDAFPMPNIDVLIGKLRNARYISKLDLTKSFHQIKLSEESKKYTSFVCELGHFEWNVVPFGIKFASPLCNRVMSSVLTGCENFACSFVDDIVVYSDNYDEHLSHLNTVLQKISDAGLTVKAKKCKFAENQVKFLGFVVGNGTVETDPAKVESIVNFPKPVTKREVRSFLGLVNFYRKFVPALSIVSIPLLDCIKKFAPNFVVYTKDVEDSVQAIKTLISEHVSLSIPKEGAPFVLQTDACDYGISGILSQTVNGVDCPISYFSRRLKDSEKCWPIIEKECLAIVESIRHYREYLYGRKFDVKTDHAPLQWLNNNKDLNSRRMRWALSLQPYDFSIKYVKGKNNFLADIFSRFHIV